jgi:hypothetical protein
LILSFIGCFGVRFNYKLGGRYALGFYAFFMVLVMLMEFFASIAIFTWVGALDDYGPAQQFKAQGIFYMINQSYIDCCCFEPSSVSGKQLSFACPNGTCWLAANLPYPCDTREKFAEFLTEYIKARIEPVAGVALFLFFLQLFTSVSACCNQCQGRKSEEKNKIGGALSYDGLYSEGEEAYSGYGYESYVKGGAAGAAAPPRPGSAAASAGATAPRAPPAAGGGQARPAPASGAAPTVPPRQPARK